MRILVTSTPGMGHLNALLPLMFALQDAGHDLLVVTAAESCEPFSTGFNGHCIAIKPNKSAVRTARIKNLLCMPTVPHRTVKIDSATLLNKPKQHFFWHNRKMLRGLHKLQSTKLTHFLPPSAQYTLTQRLVNRKFMYL